MPLRPSKVADVSIDQVDREIAAALNSGAEIAAGVRTATVSALNYLELTRVGRADFIEMLRRFPVLRCRTVEQSLRSLRSDSEVNPLMADYVEQGLYEGQSILVLDQTRAHFENGTPKNCKHVTATACLSAAAR